MDAALGCRAAVYWVQESAQWVAVCSFGFLGIGSCLLSGRCICVPPCHRRRQCQYAGACLLDTCGSGYSKGQLPIVHWLLFEECSLRLCPVVGFLRVTVDFPPSRCFVRPGVWESESKRRGLFGSRMAAQVGLPVRGQ